MALPDINAQNVINATPDDLKAQGIAKLSTIVSAAGSQIQTIIQPALDKLIVDYLEKFKTQCPDPIILQELTDKRNSIVALLNRIGKTLNIVTISLTGASNALSLIASANIAADAAKIAAQLLAPTNPAILAALPVILNTIDNTKLSFNLDSKYISRISKYQAIIGGTNVVLSIISSSITTAVETLKLIDFELLKCDPNITLSSISSEIEMLSELNFKSTLTQNQTTYKGFVIEIQEVPFDSTVNRKKAVGKNSQGIILIQTELSFTTDPQTLINELKLIIDRDNLKAY
jgi:hypothetical protein